jgi:hypothetical protein
MKMVFGGITDRLLNAAYSLTGAPLLDYLAGTMALALFATVVGEFTISVAYRVNRAHLEGLTRRLERLQGLSAEASRLGDTRSYRALNSEANDLFGRLFFQKVALSAASLWPIFFALQWMQDQLVHPLLPGTDYRINYVVAFLVCYVFARIIFGRMKPRLPYFRSVHRMLRSAHPSTVPS